MARTNKLLDDDGSVNIANAAAAAHRARRETVVTGFRMIREALHRVFITIGLVPTTR